MINKIEIKKTATANNISTERSIVVDGEFTVDQMTEVVVKLKGKLNERAEVSGDAVKVLVE